MATEGTDHDWVLRKAGKPWWTGVRQPTPRLTGNWRNGAILGEERALRGKDRRRKKRRGV